MRHDQETLGSTLESLDDAVNYRSWIIDLARPFLRGPLLELGAGRGTFTGELARFGDVRAVEPDAAGFAVLADRYRHEPRVSVVHGTVHDLERAPTFSSAVMFNVLEHIADDHQALSEIHARLCLGGHVVIWVPAFELLFSPFDRELGHHRRYRRPQLERLAGDAGFAIDESRYVNMPGWFSWLAIARLLRRRPTAGPLVSTFDRYVVPAVRAFEQRVRPPFGQSILLVGRRADRRGVTG